MAEAEAAMVGEMVVGVKTVVMEAAARVAAAKGCAAASEDVEAGSSSAVPSAACSDESLC